MKAHDWQTVLSNHFGRLDAENRRILELLTEGKTQPEIGATLGLHRSAVWRRIRKIKALTLRI